MSTIMEDKMKITFPDESSKEAEKGMSALEICKKLIGEGLARSAVAAKVDDELVDLTKPINKDAKLQIITWKDDEGKEIMRHSTSHIMAAAVKRLYPDSKLGIGPAIEDGFYYDFELQLKEEDLQKIEAEMKKIVKEKQDFVRQEVSKDDAIKMFKAEPFKVELIKEIEDETISIYKNGEFFDFCRGPHVVNTSRIGSFKLTKLAGAYWKGDAANQQLTRIYGIVFPTKHELEAHLAMIEEAEKRNHIKLGKAMDLFSIHPEGPGFPFLHPKGVVIWNELLKFWREEHRKENYHEVKTPIILSKSLWMCSGHWDNFRENMYFLKIDNQDYAIKPMNCPGGMMLYKERIHSYREFPLRVGEIGLVHRHELSGVLNGLFRVRMFHQDDAHIFMTKEMIKDEVLGVINLVDRFYKVFDLTYHLELSTRPEKSIGTDEQWETATAGLKSALDSTGKEYQINEGDGAFYGPKIDFHIKDSLGRTWQCATIQLDMSLPERFDLTYEGKDGKKHRPVMIHRVIYGAVERFFGILIEHFAGKFPMWISPVQIILLPIADRHRKHCEKVMQQMKDSGLRVELDDRAETTNKKVRDAEVKHINYILVVGDKEVKNNTVNVRTRDNEILGEKKITPFIKELLKEIQDKKIK
jgi:threonyl-tRNA synthetase